MTTTHTHPDPSAIRDAIDVTAQVLWRIRKLLHDTDFREVTTPVFRRADDLTGARATADLGQPGFLRSMIGPALRYNLGYAPRIYEIGACFRTDTPDDIHTREFSMLDLYAADEDFGFLLDLATQLVGLAYPGPIEHISVADHLLATLGIDLTSQTLAAHATAVARYLRLPAGTSPLELIETFIRVELEPRSLGKAVMFTDMPLGGNEPCARRRPGTAGILNRFEIFIDGTEVVHGYEDETDLGEFVARARAVGLYNTEQALVVEAVRSGRVPAASVGLGIGIERLCMAATGDHTITTFRQSGCF